MDQTVWRIGRRRSGAFRTAFGLSVVYVSGRGGSDGVGVVYLLVSPDGGRGRARAAAGVVRSVIEQAGHAVIDISGASPEASRQAAQAAVADGAERLVAVGGDGIVHIALQAVAGTSCVLGVVPAGTGNDFTRALGLADTSVEQAAVRALGSDRPLDVIRSERAWVASSVTGGFSVDVNNRAERLRFPRGPSRYTLAAPLTVLRLRHRRLVFTVDGERHEFTTALWAVANTPTFGGGMAICPDADPSDGLLDLTIVGDMGRVTLMRLLPAAFKGTHVKHPKVHTLRGQSIRIAPAATEHGDVAGSPRGELRGDGELIGEIPVTLTVARSCLRIAAD